MSATIVPEPTTAAPTAPRRSRYTTITVLGLLLLGVAPLLMLVTAMVSGMSLAGEGPMLAVATAIPVVAAALAWRFGTWSRIVALVVALLAAAGLFWIAFGLGAPGSFGDFVPALAFVLGFLLTVGGAVASLVARRRRRAQGTSSTAERRLVLATLAVLAVAVVGSGLMTLLASRAVADVEGAPMTQADFVFSEGTYAATAGQPTTFVVHNSDGFVHNVAVPDLDVDAVTVRPGADAVVEIPAAEAGTYTIYCTLHSDTSNPDPEQDGMVAALVVE